MQDMQTNTYLNLGEGNKFDNGDLMEVISDLDAITKELAALQKKQDNVMQLAREATRMAGEAISAMHSKDKAKVKRIMLNLEKSMKRLKTIEKGFEYYSAIAHQEYVEAYSLYCVVSNKKIPSAKAMGEDVRSYMGGVMDLVGELKREAYEAMRAGEMDIAEAYYETMKDIYDSTMHIRFANSILQNFRKKQDVARIQLETTGSELLYLKSRKSSQGNKL